MTDLAQSLPAAVFQLESDRANDVRYNMAECRSVSGDGGDFHDRLRRTRDIALTSNVGVWASA